MSFVTDMLEKYAKTQSLRVYLFSFSQFYDNISIDWITENFEMSSSEVQSTVSKLMINEELKASWDEPSRSLVLHKTEPTRLQVIIDFWKSFQTVSSEFGTSTCFSTEPANWKQWTSLWIQARIQLHRLLPIQPHER